MAVFEGSVITVRADTEEAKKKIKEMTTWLEKLEQKRADISPDFKEEDIKERVNKLAEYVVGQFSDLNFDKVFSNLGGAVDKNGNDFVKKLFRITSGMDKLSGGIKPEDLGKLSNASDIEIFKLFRELGGLEKTKATGIPVQNRINNLLEKYANGGLGFGSGSGDGFGVSEEALNRIGDTLDRIDTNVKNINDSIQSGEVVVKAIADGAEQTGQQIDKAAEAQRNLTGEIEKTKQAQDNLNASEEKLSPVEKMKQKMGLVTKEEVPSAPQEPVAETVIVVDTTSAIDSNKELQAAAETATQAIREEQTAIETPITDGTVSLVESQQELGETVEKTTEKIEKQNQILKGMSFSDKGGLQEIIQRAGNIDNVQQYVYTIDEAESKLAEIQKRHVGKKDEEKQLTPAEIKEVWGAINSLDQISLYGSNEEVERINQIFDQYEDWVERFMTQDPYGYGVLDKFSAFFEKINQYQEVLSGTDNLEQIRGLYNLDNKQKSAMMMPEQTITGYTYALDRIKNILEVMDQYKAAIEEAQAKGQEIAEEDHKFLNDYDKTKNQWNKAATRATNNLGQLQEQKRLEEERKQRIEQEKKDEKERRVLKKQQQKEDRQARIESDQQFEKDFQNYKIEDIKDMELEEIEKRIAQMEEYQNKAMGLNSELQELQQKIRVNASYKKNELPGAMDEDEIALLRPTEQETQWSETYKTQAKKRKEYTQALKKQKVKINKENEARAKVEVEKAEKAAAEAQDNAKKAEEAADRTEAVVERTEQAGQEASAIIEGTSIDSGTGEAVSGSAKTVQGEAETVKKKTMEVEKSTKTLITALEKHTQQLQEKKVKEEALVQEINNLKTNGIDFSTPQGQQQQQQIVDAGMSIEDYTASAIASKESALASLQSAIQAQEVKINEINTSIIHNKELEEQGYELIEKPRKKKVKQTKTPGEEIKGTAEKGKEKLEEANKKLEEEKKEADKLIKTGEEVQNTLAGASGVDLDKAADAILRANKRLPSYTAPGTKKTKPQAEQKPSETEPALTANQPLVGISLNIKSTKSLKDATAALKELDDVNKSIPKTANDAAQALLQEADAIQKISDTLTNIGDIGNKVGTANQKVSEVVTQAAVPEQTKPVATIKKPKATSGALSQEIKSTEEQIQTLQSLLNEGDKLIAEYDLSLERFDVGKNKGKAFSQVKRYAKQLEEDYKAVESLDKDDQSEKAQEILDKYTRSRLAFSKAYEKALAVGQPGGKDKEKIDSQMAGFAKLYEAHGFGSEGFEEAEKRFSEMTSRLEKLQQNRQQVQAVLEQQEAKLAELKQKQTPITKPETVTPAQETSKATKDEGASAEEASDEFDKLTEAKKRFTEVNQQAAQSADVTKEAIDGEKGAATDGKKAFDPKVFEDRILAQDKTIDSLRKQLEEEKAITKELQSVRKKADDDERKRLEVQNKLYQERDRQDIQRYREAGTQAQIMAQLQKKQFEEEARVRKEQEEKEEKARLQREVEAEKRRQEKEAKAAQKKQEKEAKAGVTESTNELNAAEQKLLKIKEGSRKLFVIDDDLRPVLENVEDHLTKIQDLKKTLSENPLNILDKNFKGNIENYLQQLNGTKNQPGIIAESMDVYDVSKARFDKLPTTYGKYATALSKLFTDLTSKSEKINLERLKVDLKEAARLAQSLSQTTGLDIDNLLNGELAKSSEKLDEAQTAAASKVSGQFESLLSVLSSRRDALQTVISDTFGKEGIGNLDKLFSMGNASNETKFNQFVESSQRLVEITKELSEEQNKLQTDGFAKYFGEEGNLEKVYGLLTSIKDVTKEVAEGSSNFQILGKDEIQKNKADIQQFIRANPALTGEQLEKLNDIYKQWQDGINSVDASNLVSQFDRVKQAAIDAGNTGTTFFSELTSRFKSLSTYLLSFVSFYRIIGVFKDGISVIRELDDALTEMQKVSDESLSTLKEYQKGTFDTANEIGTTAAQLQQSTADWLRLGKLNCLFI